MHYYVYIFNEVPFLSNSSFHSPMLIFEEKDNQFYLLLMSVTPGYEAFNNGLVFHQIIKKSSDQEWWSAKSQLPIEWPVRESLLEMSKPIRKIGHDSRLYMNTLTFSAIGRMDGTTAKCIVMDADFEGPRRTAISSLFYIAVIFKRHLKFSAQIKHPLPNGYYSTTLLVCQDEAVPKQARAIKPRNGQNTS